MAFSHISWREFREKEFLEWVVHRGAVLLPVAREADLFAYQLDDRPCGIREREDGRIKWVGKAFGHYLQFLTEIGLNTPVAPEDREDHGETYGTLKRSEVVRKLKNRDGCNCFFCGNVIPRGRETIEHILPKTVSKKHEGGLKIVNDLRNLALAHEECNSKAGSLSIVEKIRLRDKLRSAAYDR